jgi:hypothetical protein
MIGKIDREIRGSCGICSRLREPRLGKLSTFNAQLSTFKGRKDGDNIKPALSSLAVRAFSPLEC